MYFIFINIKYYIMTQPFQQPYMLRKSKHQVVKNLVLDHKKVSSRARVVNHDSCNSVSSVHLYIR